jgi:hypothetical protein
MPMAGVAPPFRRGLNLHDQFCTAPFRTPITCERAPDRERGNAIRNAAEKYQVRGYLDLWKIRYVKQFQRLSAPVLATVS